ncbi:MAG: NfeD family protein [Myxococcota bacterium]|jgi:membrane protein implicated in regulation of membrane protease activity|nr:NfeD family protein [Myxococcota bacterium]
MESYQVWLVGGLLLAAGEMLLGDFTLLCIGIATGSTALPALMGWSLEACLVWLAVSTVVLFVTVRPTIRRYLMADSPNITSNVHSLVGKQTRVAIEDGAPWGRAGGDHWRLESEQALDDGQEVVVVAVEGSRLRVEPL